jgi:hypothetical protein
LSHNTTRALGAWLVACVLFGAAAVPFVTSLRQTARQVASVKHLTESSKHDRHRFEQRNSALSLRVSRLDGLLASWETIGGCGAGTSVGAGGGVRWIGRSVRGGAFQLQTMGNYLHLDNGYNLTLNTMVSRDLSEKWNVGVSVPLLYKYYVDPYSISVDVSNSGVGDVSAFVMRRLGEINDTAITLQVGFPTGTHDAKFRTDLLTQDKQLGLGKFTGGVMLDHTFDETWGVIVLGGMGSYRGGENELGSYRAPLAMAYGYAGYFLGPWVPSIGLSLNHFFGVDQDRGANQRVKLWGVSATAALEWSNDWLAVLGGFSLPYGWGGPPGVDGGASDGGSAGLMPWSVGLGVTVSPF